MHELKVDQDGNWLSYESTDRKAQKEAEKLQLVMADNTKGMDIHDPNVGKLETTKVLNNSRRIDFKILNGSCIPYEGSTTSIAIEPHFGQDNKIHIEQKQIRTREFNTELCHDILKFLTKNPQAESCFDPKINLAIGEIFSKYQSKDSEKFGFGIYGSSMIGVGIGVSGLPSQDLGSQLKSPSDKFTGKSPVITAHSILESCKWNPLAGSAFNDQLWGTNSESVPNSSIPSSAVSK